MKKAMLVAFFLLGIIILPAQGIYQLWGMTPIGGDGAGVLFSTDAAGNDFQVRHQFSIGNSGASPGRIQLKEFNGKYYGMTSAGGSIDKGVIFEWDPATNVYTKKKDFNFTDGSNPSGSLTLSGGKFYGMTNKGGINNIGVIFEWDPVSNVYTKKIDFGPGKNGNPYGSLTLSGEKFYGSAGANIFEWDPVTNVYTLKNVVGAGLISLSLWNGKIYGVSSEGGSNGRGSIFEWDPVTNVYAKKIDFNVAGVAGISPIGSLTLDGDKFYGTTLGGGGNGVGVIYQWDPATNVYVKRRDLNVATGSVGNGSLVLVDGKFYGTTSQGGSNLLGG